MAWSVKRKNGSLPAHERKKREVERDVDKKGVLQQKKFFFGQKYVGEKNEDGKIDHKY